MYKGQVGLTCVGSLKASFQLTKKQANMGARKRTNNITESIKLETRLKEDYSFYFF
jgi:hypothetical protein